MTQAEVYGGLIQAHERTAHQPAVNNGPLYEALAKAQKDFKPILRTKTVQVRSDKGNYTFDYAPLESVLDATRDALAANGLALFQLLGHEGAELCLTTTLGHSSGCKVYSRMVLPQTTTGYGKDGGRFERPKTAQEIGSAVTYMRRYMAQCILGVNAEEDDDGSQGEDMPRTTQARTAPTPPKVERPKPVPQSAPPKPAEPKAPPQEPAPPLGLASLSSVAADDPSHEGRPEPGPPVSPQPPSTPPPANGDAKPSKASMDRMRGLIQELGMTQMVPEWCEKLLGVTPAKITLESQIRVLIADLEKRKAAT